MAGSRKNRPVGVVRGHHHFCSTPSLTYIHTYIHTYTQHYMQHLLSLPVPSGWPLLFRKGSGDVRIRLAEEISTLRRRFTCGELEGADRENVLFLPIPRSGAAVYHHPKLLILYSDLKLQQDMQRSRHGRVKSPPSRHLDPLTPRSCSEGL